MSKEKVEEEGECEDGTQVNDILKVDCITKFLDLIAQLVKCNYSTVPYSAARVAGPNEVRSLKQKKIKKIVKNFRIRTRNPT